ncbi:MAG: helix-turn-helix domain-containing protein [Lachnospiraceae bacterium]|nr:helix-turn-helix domain-containing protein [Lachnospiraceae bacterium]
MNDPFGETIRKLRLEKGLSQKQLGDLLFIDHSTIARWENGNRLPDAIFPKFDIASEMDLAQILPTMGITDVLDPGLADFSPLFLQDTKAALTRMDHAARISVDEWGVTAAAYTVERMEGSTESTGKHMDFICDRPFVFAITDPNRITFFEGVVNKP